MFRFRAVNRELVVRLAIVSGMVLFILVTRPAGAAERQVLRGQVPAALSLLPPVERLAASKRLDLAIGLPLRNRGELTNLLREIYDPTSPHYRQYLTPEQFAERFGPTEEDYQALIAFAKANGLTVTGTHPNRTLVDVNGPAVSIERTFQVNLRVYQHPTENRTCFAPDAQPSVNLAVPLLAVSGLDDFMLPRPMALSTNFSSQALSAPPQRNGSGPRGNFIGRDFRAAYAPGVSLDGSGQSVGLFELDGYHPNDVAAYQSLAGLPTVTISNVLLNGFDGKPGINNIEVALDIAMAVSMAPGLSSVIVYAGRVPNDVLNRMATDNAARQLSSSWGFGPQVDPVREQIFLQFAAQGQSFFQASGDLGAWAGPIFPPSDDPWVTVVGGTSLETSGPGGPWMSESAWFAGGGGISTTYAIPIWQQSVNMAANRGSTSRRNIPDVALLSDDVIWLVANNGEQGVIGGTSAAAPLWAGFAALVNQQAAAEGKPSVGFLNPLLYAIGQGSGYTAAFHDITTGNNTNSSSPDKFFAVSGYDLCTGWGTPTGSNLINALLAPSDALRVTPGVALTFSGPPGGPFDPTTQGYSLTNEGAGSLNWTRANAVPWLEVSPANGTLTAGGPAAMVEVTLNVLASDLPVGSHTTTIWFTNLNNGFGQSRRVTLNVVAPPIITAQPANQAVFEGMTATFTVDTATNAALSYQWRHDNGVYLTNLSDGGNFFGSTTHVLTVNNVSPADVGAYSVMVSNAAGVAVSSNAFLTIVPWRPVITTQPASRTALPGETVRLTVTVVGSQPLFYHWQKDGNRLTDDGNLSGTTTAGLTITNVSSANAGTYSVIVSNTLGVTASLGAVLSVASVTAPGVTMATLYSFTGGEDGANPNGLVLGTDGIFYGTTQNGGRDFAGTVFGMTSNGLFASLYSFSGGSDGANPYAALALGPDGFFYGATFQGGASDNGTIFRTTPVGTPVTLISFHVTNGTLPYAGLTLGADANFYGTSYQGGAFGRGTAFKLSTNGTLTTLHSFSNSTDGGHPAARLVQGRSGGFYGTTYKGGLRDNGTVFTIATNGDLTSLASFNRTNGAFPFGGLAEGDNGNLYGATANGGSHDAGTIYRISPTGLLTSLYSFAGSNGANPRATLLQAADGNFYGTTRAGGTYGQGTVFTLAPDGTLATLVHFDGYNGANPQAALVGGADGHLYGTTQHGGASGWGTIFRLGISAAPQITSQPGNQAVFEGANVELSVAAFGSVPMSYRWRKNGTNLFDEGNVSGSGARVLKLNHVTSANAGIYAVTVSNFLGSILSAEAVLQVTSSPPFIVTHPANQTVAPGATVTFAVTALGNLPLSYQWQRNGTNLIDGGPVSGSSAATLTLKNVTEAANGTYAVIVSNALDSVRSSGAVLTVIPVSAPGTRLATLHGFTVAGSDGATPNELTLGTDGHLYGTTRTGGAHRFHGTIFSMTTDGLLTTLISFRGTNGSVPVAALVEGTNGSFYGTTRQGGNTVGTVFRVTPEGTLTNLYSFTGKSDGGYPSVALVQGADGGFYGAAENFFTSNDNLFRLAPDGTLSNFYSFTGGVDGDSLVGALLQGMDGNLYGMTGAGGAYGYGTVFKLTPNGALTTLYPFTGGRDGYAPVGALVQGADGDFYGVTKYNTILGFRFYGTIFKLTTNGVLTTLYALNFTDGSYPAAGVIQGSDGNLYGTTRDGGSSGNGTIFRVAPSGTFTTLASFDGFNTGAHSEAALVEGADGSLYGTTTSGGPGGGGTIFRLRSTSSPQITSQPTRQTVVAGANTAFSVAVFGAHPLSYQWRKDGIDLTDGGDRVGSTTRILRLGNVRSTDAGTYSVTVSNALGSVTSAGALLTVNFPPEFQSIRRTSGTVTLTWSAAAGRRYQLQYKSNLSATTWTNLGGAITATVGTVTVSDGIGSSSQRFYRVVLLP